MGERLVVVQDKEVNALEEGRRLTGSMIGGRRVTLTWVIGKA